MPGIHIEENGIYVELLVTDKKQLKLVHCSCVPLSKQLIENIYHLDEGFPLVQINCAGFDRPFERHGNKYVVTSPGCFLTYEGYTKEKNQWGNLYCFVQEELQSQLKVISYLQFYENCKVIRSWSEVRNNGVEEQTLEYLSSFSYTGFEKEGEGYAQEKMTISIPHNGWQKEFNWRTYSLDELGMVKTQYKSIERSSKTIEVFNTGNWSTKEYLPMGYLENTSGNTGLLWQIEHNGSWHYEIADQNDFMVLNLSGPTEIQSHWSRRLSNGESFVSVPVAIAVTDANKEHAFAEMTIYRRNIRRINRDNRELPVIFNDYMNCLWADPTTEKEIPYINLASKIGCEYYVIDAGWYDSGHWWDKVGVWRECKERFPTGIKELTDYIRSKGMIPGLWLEVEVMGTKCEMADQLPDNWFFVRHKKRVMDRSRYQLDFSNPEVRKYATEVIDRMVQEYNVGYIKMDYNIEPGIGTEQQSDSFGDGLLKHERAYLEWLDSIFVKYPELVIENCSSGGLRMDYALLSKCSIQSTSDQEEYKNYAMIATNAATGVTPEQAAVWSYPLQEDSIEAVIFNMVNALLLRIHLSGELVLLRTRELELVKEGIQQYKAIRNDIKLSKPYWPLGFAKSSDRWMSYGCVIEESKVAYLAVWKLKEGEDSVTINPLPTKWKEKGVKVEVSTYYPISLETKYQYEEEKQSLKIIMEEPLQARIFKIIIR